MRRIRNMINSGTPFSFDGRKVLSGRNPRRSRARFRSTAANSLMEVWRNMDAEVDDMERMYQEIKEAWSAQVNIYRKLADIIPAVVEHFNTIIKNWIPAVKDTSIEETDYGITIILESTQDFDSIVFDELDDYLSRISIKNASFNLYDDRIEVDIEVTRIGTLAPFYNAIKKAKDEFGYLKYWR